MADIWVILAQLPLMLILAFVVGYEPVVFMGIGLFGLLFWLFSEEHALKRSAFVIFVIGEFLFITAVLFHISSGRVPPENPFEFVFIKTMINFINIFK